MFVTVTNYHWQTEKLETVHVNPLHVIAMQEENDEEHELGPFTLLYLSSLGEEYHWVLRVPDPHRDIAAKIKAAAADHPVGPGPWVVFEDMTYVGLRHVDLSRVMYVEDVIDEECGDVAMIVQTSQLWSGVADPDRVFARKLNELLRDR